MYASPEIVKGTPYHGPEVDCWSLGVLLYTLVYGAMPFDGSNFKRLVKQISQGDYFEPKRPSRKFNFFKWNFYSFLMDFLINHNYFLSRIAINKGNVNSKSKK